MNSTFLRDFLNGNNTGYIICGKKAWGGTPLYKLYRYVLPNQVGFLRHFGLKTGCPFWSGIVYGF